MCISNLLPAMSMQLAREPRLGNHHSTSPGFRYSSPSSPGACRKQSILFRMDASHSVGCPSGLGSPLALQPQRPTGLTSPCPLGCRFLVSRPPHSFPLHPCLWLFAFCFSRAPVFLRIHPCLPDSHIQASSGISPSSSSSSLCRYLHF